MTKDTIKLNIESWNIKTKERKRNRMRLRIDLDKDETLAFTNFKNSAKPEDLSDDQFMKAIFLTGIESMTKELFKRVKEYAEAHREELEASGIKFFDPEEVESVSPSA